MSVQAITWAMQQRTGSPATKAVLIALANYADENGTCFPGQDRIAWETEQSDRTVRRQLDRLEELGLITREHRYRDDGKRTSDRYRLALPENLSGSGGDYRTSEAGTTGHGWPLKNRKYEPSVKDVSEAASPPQDATPREDVELLCILLADKIEANGSKRPTITKAWRDAARLMIDTDGRAADQIARVIEWCQTDPFWRANIMSMPKLRKQYDTLRLQATRNAPTPQQTARHNQRTGWMYT